ncbi:hypothetical protein [Paenibacillus aestuarii]|uniref:Uncharacterized protein n=1 Tax=Paenibacillus aestuarii TaxID=516965 RepID=A0ABW0KHK0_9BACL|nr:hypothetical protein [Paenibacillus aestuarii]
MLVSKWRQPEAVGNVGSVWPPGFTGVKIYGSLPSGVHFYGPVHSYHHLPYYFNAPMYLGFPSVGNYYY